MYKLLFALLMTVGMTTAMCAQQKQKMNSKHSNSKILVAYSRQPVRQPAQQKSWEQRWVETSIR